MGELMTTKPATVLVADDDRSIRTVITQALRRAGFEVQATGQGKTLWQWIAKGEGDLVITDVMMPDENGLDLVPRIRSARPDLNVIVISAKNTLMTAVKATERGAFEYLPKPFDIGQLVDISRRAISQEKAPANDASLFASEEKTRLVGRSLAMQEIYRTMARLMFSDLTVMIAGESGTGKELVARALHECGKWKEGPFVAVNMAAIPRELIESELFGHEKGAFTGATQRHSGRFEQAQGGTLFLDEIGDMPMEAQTRLLRVLQEGEFTTVGGKRVLRTNLRIIAATNRDLQELVRLGRFREDLYYRLNVVPMRLPALRERLEDVPALVEAFLKECGSRKRFDTHALGLLAQQSWPGNIRELKNIVLRLDALCPHETVTEDMVRAALDKPQQHGQPGSVATSSGCLQEAVQKHLERYFAAHKNSLPPEGLYERVLQEIEKPLLNLTLQATGGNQIQAAAVLGLNRNTLRKKIRDLKISIHRGKNQDEAQHG